MKKTKQFFMSLIQKGFGFALTHQKDGIMQGKGAFVALGASDIHKQLTDWSDTYFYSLNKGKSKQSYPSSQMGSIALLRQAFYDAEWYQNAWDIFKQFWVMFGHFELSAKFIVCFLQKLWNPKRCL